MNSLFKYKGRQIGIADILLLFVMIFGAVIIIIPFVYMIGISLMSPSDIADGGNFIPEEFYFSNYKEAFTAAPFARYTFNTVFIAFFCVIGAVISNAFIGYGFAKINFPGRETAFGIVVATMIIPAFVTLIPTFIIFTKLGWYGTYLPLIVPAFFGNAFYIFMVRQFFKTIPNELIEAAQIDGATHFYIWSRIMLPLIKPLLASIALFTFKGVWNDFTGPLLYSNSETMYTIQLGLASFSDVSGTDWNYLMAMTLFSMLPVVIIFFSFQKYFVEGLNTSGATK